MKKISVFLLLSLYSIVLFAHNAQISTMVLVQSNDNKWHLILSTSLTAFQYELKNSNPKLNLENINAEQFQEIILKHLREKIQVEANNKNIPLKNARVILGHQTDINFELSNMPQNIEKLNIQNLGFSTLRDHYCVLKILRKNGMENNIMLQKDNKFMVSLEAKNDSLVEVVSHNESNSLIYFLVILVIPFLLIRIFKVRKNQKKILEMSLVN